MDLQADGGARSPEFYPLTGSRFRSCWQTHVVVALPFPIIGQEFLETVAPLLLKRRPRVPTSSGEGERVGRGAAREVAGAGGGFW